MDTKSDMKFLIDPVRRLRDCGQKDTQLGPQQTTWVTRDQWYPQWLPKQTEVKQSEDVS